MRKHSIVWGLVAAWILAGCGGTVEEGSDEVPGPEEPEEPVSEMHVPATQSAPRSSMLDNQGLSAPLRMPPTGAVIGKRIIRVRIARPRRQPTTLLPSTNQLNTLQLLAPVKSEQFDGLGKGLSSFSTMYTHPSPSGDVGPLHYVQFVNDSLAVFDKASKKPIVGPMSAHKLWVGTNTGCEFGAIVDGVVRFDATAENPANPLKKGRWIITHRAIVEESQRMNHEPRYALGVVEPASTASELSGPRAFHAKRVDYYQCVAVSQTDDPTGSYYRYIAKFEQSNEAPKLGVWPDAYYLTTTLSTSHVDGNPRHATICAMDRKKMLRGMDATMLCFDVASHAKHYADLLPADLDGKKEPPPGSPLYVFSLRQTPPKVPMTMPSKTYDFYNRIGVWRFRVDWANPMASTLRGPLELQLKERDSFQQAFEVPQPGTGTPKLDPLGYKLVGRAPYRNFDDGQFILLTHAIPTILRNNQVSGSGMRWYELRLPADPSTDDWPSLSQHGTYAPDDKYRWLGSIAFDDAHNIALGYSIASKSLFPSLRYTGRMKDCPKGTMARMDKTLKQGSKPQLLATGEDKDFPSTWGTSSSLNIDPDGCTFWFTGEYRSTSMEKEWSTSINSFRLPGCVSSDPKPSCN